MQVTNKITVVIPTKNRPEMVVKAVNSVIAQTYSLLEINVVIDGPDSETRQRLSLINDNRLNIFELPISVGGAEARNIGVKMATSEWIAFLDDDDEWLPNKLLIQMEAVKHLDNNITPIVVCKMIVKSDRNEYVWPPDDFPTKLEDISRFIFCTRRIGKSAGIFVTSMLFTRKSLLQSVSFQKLLRFQDVDWLLRAIHGNKDVRFVGVDETLLTLDASQDRPRISTDNNIKICNFSIRWAYNLYTNKLIDKKSYIYLIYGHISGMAKYVGGNDLFVRISKAGLVFDSSLPLLFLGHVVKWLGYRFISFVNK